MQTDFPKDLGAFKPAPMAVPPSMSKSAIAIEPSGKTGACENVTTPPEDIAIASLSEALPMFPASAITIPALKVASPAALPSIVRKVVSAPQSVPFNIMSVSSP